MSLWLLVRMLRIELSLLLKKANAQRLLDSLQMDASKPFRQRGWKPPTLVDEGLRRSVQQGL